MTDVAERKARTSLFAKIEKDILPAAEARVAAIGQFEVEGIGFGAHPSQKAFGAEGELRFEIGRWNGSRFEQFGSRMLYPVRLPKMDVEYPEEVVLVPSLSTVNVHYTPVTRRLDYFEVWDYFSVMKARETDVRHKAFGLLESRIAKKYPEAKIRTSVRYIRYSEYYAVVTEVESREFAAAGEEERKAISSLCAAN